MSEVMIAPRIVCKICGTEENVTSVMAEPFVTPTSIIQPFVCRCAECMMDFRFEVIKLRSGMVRFGTSQ